MEVKVVTSNQSLTPQILRDADTVLDQFIDDISLIVISFPFSTCNGAVVNSHEFPILYEPPVILILVGALIQLTVIESES
jgi:hypothetical protein